MKKRERGGLCRKRHTVSVQVFPSLSHKLARIFYRIKTIGKNQKLTSWGGKGAEIVNIAKLLRGVLCVKRKAVLRDESDWKAFLFVGCEEF